MPKKKIGKIKEQKEKPDYKIYGVRKMDDFAPIERELPRPLHTMLEKGGGVLALFAPPGSGKSNFISNLLLRDDFFKDLFEGGLYIISPTIMNDLTSCHLRDYADFTETQYSEELVGGLFQMLMDTPNDEKALSCLLLDDCLGSIKMNSICNRVASTCRHNRQLVIFSLQAIKNGLPSSIRSNISHTITFYQPSSKQLADVVELHSMMGGEENFLKCYNEATAEKYGFLLSDFRDMKLWKWGGQTNEPELVWSRYDENGNIINPTKQTKDDIKTGNKSMLKEDPI
tara:strand:- start:1242 stop:2096 length:855 start_codon:yes stop_codon:yes gene_type:complete